MPGVVFLVVVPTANFERVYFNGHQLDNNELLLQSPEVLSNTIEGVNDGRHGDGNNLNINHSDNNAILRLEVELRDKNASKQHGRGRGGIRIGGRSKARPRDGDIGQKDNLNLIVPMEKVLEELLSKLEIEHVTWSSDKKGNYYHVVFPIQSGEPCETTLHCLTELGIGTKLNSSVSVLPCSVTYDATMELSNNDYSEDVEELSKWNNFVESIKSKLTVKQVVDGVRAGGSLSFDYVILIVTADSLAALGLVENNAPNIVAAMLVSPLMGPVMSITFGAIISDRELMKVGFISLALGMFISLLFGFIFGLILGTTDMPWGFGDWPTEEMKGRGNVRSLWMGVLWALTSGTGVAVALLQGSAGPLIGVAISASLLPPVVNCGLFWALACIWLIYPNIKLPHLKGEPYVGNSSYEFIYTNYLPTEFLISGIVSGLLTVVNVICIFITAIIVLKIKEVAAPYTSSPDLRRFWETDIRTVRKTNRSTIRRKATFKGKMIQPYEGLNDPKNRELETALGQALKEAVDDATFRKVKRMSYSSNAAGELTQRLPFNMNSGISGIGNDSGNGGGSINSVRNSKLNADLQALDKLVSSLLEHHQYSNQRNPSTKLNRWRPLSRSVTNFMSGIGQSMSNNIGQNSSNQHDGESIKSQKFNGNDSGNLIGNTNGNNLNGAMMQQHTSLMPTILEQQNQIGGEVGGHGEFDRRNRNSCESVRGGKITIGNRNSGNDHIRAVLNTIANAPHRFSQSINAKDEENANLTQNILD